ncbi:MAG TPA: acetoacetate--CoA ligase [Porticoccaceae bacterium]|nr:acetoacetate--CoA ligase [Porticoccaceae bacterium]
MKKLWEPSAQRQADSNMTAYMEWLAAERGLSFSDYETLYQWSITELEAFWQSIWDYYQVQSATPFERVLSTPVMPGARWFEGSTLNFAEHIFRARSDDRPALMAESETQELYEVSWAALHQQVARLAHYLRKLGVEPGDRVVAYMPNIPEAVVAFLAANAIGAVWSSCSPDFGTNSVVDRFQQISPRVLFAVDGYSYNGKTINRLDELARLKADLPSLERIVLFDYQGNAEACTVPDTDHWTDALDNPATEIVFEQVAFDHPIWTLYSSGTTGIPKAITHGHGGILLEHYKHMGLHCDIKPGDRFFWFSTTGWVMWNIGVASMLTGSVLVIYDGNPAFPDTGRLWSLAERARLNQFGGGAAYYIACMKEGMKPGDDYDLSALKAVGSTGSPLPEEGFEWVYDAVKKDVWLISISGGTDIASAFVGCSPLLPVYSGEIQCRMLGVDVRALDDEGKALVDEVGEMVITQPMPSMPIYFWNDEGDVRYRESYFEDYPDWWRHGDWMRLSGAGTIQIMGRSDSTLNRGGIRIGTSEVYRGVEKVEAVADSLVISLELSGGRHYMPLFVQLQPGLTLSDDIIGQIKQSLRSDFTPRHVPDEVFQIDEVPYTMTGKKLETPVKKILMGFDIDTSVNRDAMRNPETIDYFIEFSEKTLKM